MDGNVVRVFSRLRAIQFEDKSKDMEKQCWTLAKQLVDPMDPSSFNQALMELGAMVCKPLEPGLFHLSCERVVCRTYNY